MLKELRVVDRADVLEQAYPWCRDWEEELRALFRAYVEAKLERQVLDYDDLLLYLGHLLDASADGLGLSGSPTNGGVGEGLLPVYSLNRENYQSKNKSGSSRLASFGMKRLASLGFKR